MARRWLRGKLASRVLVVLKDGKSVTGWLEDEAPDGLVLRTPALLLEGSDDPVPLQGELFVPAINVLFVQLGGSF